MIVRRRRDDDVTACTRLVLEAHAVDGYPGHLPDDLPRFVAPPYERHAWVAEAGGEVVGHVALHEAEDDPVLATAQRATGLGPERLAVLARLFVAPAARGAAVGRTLVDTAVAQAGSEGRRTVLDVVRSMPAVGFYDALGWQPIGDLRFTVGSTELDLLVYLSPG